MDGDQPTLRLFEDRREDVLDADTRSHAGSFVPRPGFSCPKGILEPKRELFNLCFFAVYVFFSFIAFVLSLFGAVSSFFVGCGHGLVGLLLLQLGAHTAVFQDLNEGVLTEITKPTVLANLREDGSRCGEARGVHREKSRGDAVEERSGNSDDQRRDRDPKHQVHLLRPPEEEKQVPSSSPCLGGTQNVSAGSSFVRDKTCYFIATDWRNFPPLCCLCSCQCQGKKNRQLGHELPQCYESHRLSSRGTKEEERDSKEGSSASSTTVGVCSRSTTNAAAFDQSLGVAPSPAEHQQLQFDWIVASECIYRPSNFQTLLDLLRSRLKRNTGIALLAAKR